MTLTAPAGSPVAVRLSAEDLAGGEEHRAEQWELTAPWQGTLELPRRSRWRLNAAAQGFWAAERIVPEEALQPVALRLWPTALLTGTLRLPPGETAPETLAARFHGVPSAQGKIDPDLPESLIPCPIVERRWSCPLPAAPIDLRLAAEGFIPHYLWDLALGAGDQRDLGPLRLERGASIAGWVEAEAAETPEPSIAVEIEPRNSGWLGDPSRRQRMSSLSRKTRANRRGFFQLSGVSPGGYVLIARLPGRPPARLFPLDVEAGEEFVLDEPLVIYPPSELRLFVEPPADPQGLPWRIALRRLEPMTSVGRTVEEGLAAADGSWQRQGLEAGVYLLAITDAHGSQWVREELTIDPGARHEHPVEIPLVPVVGRLTRGDEPLAGTLVFGTTQGRRQVRMTADEEGDFEGYLPKEGLWPVELALSTDPSDPFAQALEPVEVRVSSGQRVARLAIELPDTRLSGQVFEEGRPVAADLALMRTGEVKRREAILLTEPDGSFELLGLTPGEILIRASRKQRSTEWVTVEILDGVDTPRLELVIEDKITVAGQVLRGYAPFAGARIVASPLTASGFGLVAKAVSEADGFFELKLPPHTSAADVLVVPPGFAIQLFRTGVSPEAPPLLLELDPGGGTLFLGRQAGSGRRLTEATLSHRGAAFSVRLLLSLLWSAERWERTGERLTLRGMEAGEYRLCHRDAGCRSTFLSPGGEAELLLPTEVAGVASSDGEEDP